MNRTLILMRHGQAAAPSGTPDHERPLTAGGAAQAAEAGAWLAAHLPPIRAVVCSTALRTRSTLDAVARGAGWPDGGTTGPDGAHAGPDGGTAGLGAAHARPDGARRSPQRTYTRAVYEAAPEAILGEIALTDDDASPLLVVGHFPGLPQTALALDPAGPHSAAVRRGLPTAGCIVLRSSMPWQAFPDALRGAATPFAGIRAVRTG